MKTFNINKNIESCLKSIDAIVIIAEELSKQSLSKLEDNLRVILLEHNTNLIYMISARIKDFRFIQVMKQNALTSLLNLSGEGWRSTKYSYGISSI